MNYSVQIINAISCSLLLFMTHFAHAQNSINTKTEKKTMQAIRTDKPPKIDGKLDDPAWLNASPETNFTQESPTPGNPASLNTETRLLYDDQAIYMAFRMYDSSKDSVMRELSLRDNSANTDRAICIFDTYRDGINAFGFQVSAAGVQGDFRISANGEDSSWDAVWQSEVAILDDGWVAELRIPYSALRFPTTPVQSWGINFGRDIRRKRENVWWNTIRPEGNGFVNQSGILENIKDIKAPLRLSLSPYISYNLQHFPNNNSNNKPLKGNFRAGMDLKYGINDAFTLDMTLVPDFGQTRSDDQVYNISPFEVRFQENRPFFTEGTELFNKGDFFYSRRIGRRPENYYNVSDNINENEEIINNPTETQLLNSTKVSGRTKNGLGVGIFNSITKEMNATIKRPDQTTYQIQTEPLSNYNVLVLDQSLKNNSYVSLINTNVMRSGTMYDANMTGGLFDFNDKNNKYGIGGKFALSQQYGFEDPNKPTLGHSWGINGGKRSGNWQYWANYNEVSDKYDINDVGYLSNNNFRNAGAGINYTAFKPKNKKLQRWGINANINYNRFFKPDAFADLSINTNAWANTIHFFTFGGWLGGCPTLTYDFYDPRVVGRFYTYPRNIWAGAWISSDYRKKFAIDINLGANTYANENSNPNQNDIDIAISPRYRVNNKLNFIISSNINFRNNNIGFATFRDDNIITYGRRDVRTYSQIFTANYTFSNKMALTFRARHYSSQVTYRSFHNLAPDGFLQPTDYTGLDTQNQPQHNANFNAFNIDMVYSWQVAPGSFLTVGWKDAIFSFNNNSEAAYFNNLQKTFKEAQNNNFSIKILYYIDYLTVKNKLKKS